MSKEYLTKALFNSIDKLTFDNIEEVEKDAKYPQSWDECENRDDEYDFFINGPRDNEGNIKEGHLTNEQLNTIEAEICAKDDIKTNCECKNNDDIVILVDTRFEKRCIRISIRS